MPSRDDNIQIKFSTFSEHSAPVDIVVFLGNPIFIIRSFFQAEVLPIYNTEIIEGVSGNGNGTSSKLHIVNLVVCYHVV